MPQPKPFPNDVQWPLQSSGAFLSFDQGRLQARIFNDTGHLELAGPDLAGNNAANTVRFAPPAVQTTVGSLLFGRVISSKQLGNGLELTQALGSTQITTRLTFIHDGVLRYEVVNWGSANPVATAIASPSDGKEHFYGFGEKFDGVDQAGKSIRTLSFDDPGVKGDHSYKVSPWFVSTRGYGFHLDSSAESVFDMRAGAGDRYVVTNQFASLRFNIVYGPWPERVHFLRSACHPPRRVRQPGIRSRVLIIQGHDRRDSQLGVCDRPAFGRKVQMLGNYSANAMHRERHLQRAPLSRFRSSGFHYFLC